MDLLNCDYQYVLPCYQHVNSQYLSRKTLGYFGYSWIRSFPEVAMQVIDGITDVFCKKAAIYWVFIYYWLHGLGLLLGQRLRINKVRVKLEEIIAQTKRRLW